MKATNNYSESFISILDRKKLLIYMYVDEDGLSNVYPIEFEEIERLVIFFYPKYYY